MRQHDGKAESKPRRPRWLPAVATVAGVLLTASAGNWQLNRAHEKERLQGEYDRGAADPPILLAAHPVGAEEMRLRRVEVSGEFVPGGLVLLDNRVRDGRPGYEVVMPLKIGDSPMHALIDRGWVPAGPDRKKLPDIRTPQGAVKIIGVATVPGRFFELSNAEDKGPVWQNLTVDRFAARTGMKVQPVVVQQQSEIDDGLVRSRERPDFGISKHYGYAAQRFSFCTLMIVLFAYFHARSFRSKKNQADVPDTRSD